MNMTTDGMGASQQHKKRILIVDDSEDMRILLEQILEEEDMYTLQFAESGQQVLDKAKHFLPDLILMDMSLPGMSGWEVVPLLRRLPAFSHTPIIAVTAHVSRADQERSLALGCTTHLGKPFDITTVLTAIASALEDASPTSTL
jgi:two-component system, cell cycle response regulator DivK